MNEQDIEKEIQAKGLNAPRLTPAYIDGRISKEEYHVFGTTTVCCLTLQNRFKVIGESACTSPKNFDEELGRNIAKENARSKIWQLEGYRLRQLLWESSLDSAGNVGVEDDSVSLYPKM